MNPTMTESKSSAIRSHTHALDIAAAPDEVWKAITDPKELVQWFPLEASCKPGRGGEIRYQWGELVGICRVQEWQPGKHLRTGWMEMSAEGASADCPRLTETLMPQRAQLAVDWFLEGHGGKTHLRLVHSGFTKDAEWDKEYEGTRRGWQFELQALKHYLEHHRGETRHAFWLRERVALGPQDVWNKFAEPGGFFRTVDLAAGRIGKTYRFVLGNGDELAGAVLINHPPYEFAGTATTLGGGMIRFGFEDCMGGPEAHVWIATWGLPSAKTSEVEARWRGMLHQAFPPN